MLGVIVPARNEEDNIEAVIENILDSNILAEDIYVLDNDSTDKTRAIAEKKRVNIHLVKKLGYQSALKEGFQLLIKKKYSKFCIVDGDNEIVRESIKIAIKKSKDYDLVIGRRPFVKRFGERIVNKLINYLYGIEDLMCGVKSGNLSLYNQKNNLEYGIDLINFKEIPKRAIYNFQIKLNPRNETRLGNSFIVNIKLIANILIFMVRR
jgi:glycosyltransferase involved in cell wall biosynthesis